MNDVINRVQTAIPDATITQLNTAIATLETQLATYLVAAVTPAEKRRFAKINVENKVFVEDAINAMDTPAAAAIMPAYISSAAAKTDLKVFNQMETLLQRISNLSIRINNTRMLAGAEAYSTALKFKKMADVAEAAGIQGADQIATVLRTRFKGQSSNSNGSANSGNPPGSTSGNPSS